MLFLCVDLDMLENFAAASVFSMRIPYRFFPEFPQAETTSLSMLSLPLSLMHPCPCVSCHCHKHHGDDPQPGKQSSLDIQCRWGLTAGGFC